MLAPDARSHIVALLGPTNTGKTHRAVERMLGHRTGFTWLRCPGCSRDLLLAFSCKERGFCPSCGGRRMKQLAANLVDHVIPHVPVRQWVLSFPMRVRVELARRPELRNEVLGLLLGEAAAAITGRPESAWGTASSARASDDRRAASSEWFDLHAGDSVPAWDRERLERLVRYVARRYDDFGFSARVKLSCLSTAANGGRGSTRGPDGDERTAARTASENASGQGSCDRSYAWANPRPALPAGTQVGVERCGGPV